MHVNWFKDPDNVVYCKEEVLPGCRRSWGSEIWRSAWRPSARRP